MFRKIIFSLATYGFAFSVLPAQDWNSQNEPAKLLKKETRDFYKEGPVEAEIWEETVSLISPVSWEATEEPEIIGLEFERHADFLMPVRVLYFETLDGDQWKLGLSVFPSFDSNTLRIPGPQPEFYGEPFRALITKPKQRELVLTGTRNAAKLKEVFLPGTVWAGAFQDGKLQQLRIGDTDLPPAIEVSRLSAPFFTVTDPMSFQFNATCLNQPPVSLQVTPERLLGADMTIYNFMKELGGPPDENFDADWLEYVHSVWNIVVGVDQAVNVIAPLMDGRGAAGMLELESLSLGPDYEADLKALVKFGEEKAPPLPQPPPSGWNDILKSKLGEIPASQRTRNETQY